MGLDICKKHPGRKAVGHCEHCHIPLCEECAIVSDHPKAKGKKFCSEEHLQSLITYSEAMGGKELKRIRPPSIFVSIIKYALIGGVIWAALSYFNVIPAKFQIPGL